MKKYILCTCFFFVLQGQAQEPSVNNVNLASRIQFQDNKFGLFIHWGASSVLGDGEWVMENKAIQFKDYQKLQQIFNPNSFDADQWVRIAKDAGMKYIVFITRHHDGFSNWDTRFSDWKITNTPYQKDPLKLLAAACKRAGIQLGLYYSTLDWSRSDYPYETGRTGQKSGRIGKSNYASYLQFMKNQLTELLTNYGAISCIWLDGHWDQTNPEGAADRNSRIDWKYEEIYGLIHQLQPATMIGNNHHLDPLPGEDFQMFEQDLPGQNKAGLSFQTASVLPLESCITMNNSWGFKITDNGFKTYPEIIRTLVGAAGRNSNLLLNVGPMPNGIIQKEFTDTLALVGNWVKNFGQTIYGTRGGPMVPATWGVTTENKENVYLHLFSKPEKDEIVIEGEYALNKIQFLHSSQKAVVKQVPGKIIVSTAQLNFTEIDLVLVLPKK